MKTQFQKKALNVALIFVTSISLSGQLAICQTQNALSYDGVNDKVVATGASSLIANSTGISMSCWVYPSNATPAWPDFDAFVDRKSVV